MKNNLLIITSLVLTIIPSVAISKVQGVISIETEILAPDPQFGVKSTQTISLYVDTSSGKFAPKSSFTVGSTDLYVGKVKPIRNKFEVTNIKSEVSSGFISFTAIGQTASGVAILPNIDYSFNISFSSKNKENIWSVTGCHDGYPAYKINFINLISGKKQVLYNFKHEPLGIAKLLGTCDIEVNSKSIKAD